MSLLIILLQIVCLVCLLTALAGYVWLIALAFQKSVPWGVGCLVPFVGLIFAIQYWNESWKPFTLAVTATACLLTIGLVTFVLENSLSHVELIQESL